MRNDFFKHILLSGGSRQNRTELETETLPYTFTLDAYKLRNYRIYGNTVNEESVGNLVTEGEHAGEYCVPVTVTVEGKNILPMSTTPISRDIDDFHCEYDGVGTITLTTDKNNAQLSKFYIPLSQDFVIPISVGQGGGGCLQFNNSIASPNTYNDYIAVEFYNDNTAIDIWRLTTINRIHSSYTLLGGKTINCMAVIVSGTGFGTNRKLVIKPAIVLNTTEQVPFEPHHAPITTNLYLPEQIKIVGDEAEYVDYKEQKQHFSDGTSVDVTLPVLPTLKGTNTLSVGTTVQPSKIWIQGNISEIETVSTETQALQTNMQSLQPLSLDENAELDVMPSDKNEFQTNDISEMPVEDENSIEEILETENLETTGDGENAE